MKLNLRKLSYALGAEVLDFKITDNLSTDIVAQLREAFLAHNVLLFRNQELSHELHKQFSSHFGPLDPHDSVPDYRLPDHPEILKVTNAGKERSKVFGTTWHTDHSMTLHPSLASLLRADEIPDVGGETSFANMYLAWETLSPTLQNVLRPLDAVHTVVNARHLQSVDPEVRAAKARNNPPVAHPVMRIHNETGRPALYVNEMLTSQFVGMTYDESRPLLEYLFKHSVRPEFTWRQQWRKGDLIIWDNRCTMHIAHADYDHSKVRRLFRTTIMGPQSGYPYEEAV